MPAEFVEEFMFNQEYFEPYASEVSRIVTIFLDRNVFCGDNTQ